MFLPRHYQRPVHLDLLLPLSTIHAKTVLMVSTKSFRQPRRMDAKAVMVAIQLWIRKQHVHFVLLERLKQFKTTTPKQREYIVYICSTSSFNYLFSNFNSVLFFFNFLSYYRCTDCQPGATSNDIALECLACPIAKFSFFAGSPKCSDCDVSQKEYTDGLGSTQCRTCGEEEYSTGSECKISTRMMDAGTPGKKCNIIFWESKLDGCLAANKPFCKQAMTALFVPSPLDSSEITGCDETCESVLNIKQSTDALYQTNLIDMIIELVALIAVCCAVGITLISSDQAEAMGLAVHAMMCCFAITDLIGFSFDIQTSVTQ